MRTFWKARRRGPRLAAAPLLPVEPPAVNRTVVAIAFMCLAVSLFPFQNAIVKYLSGSYPVTEVIWARFAGHLLFINLLFLPRFGRRLYATSRPGMQIARSLMMLGSVGCFVWGVSHLPLALASAIGFTAPLVVTALSVPLLGERVGWRRWSAVCAGFAGALVIIRPGLGDTHWAVGVLLAGVLCYALYQILTRRIGSADPPAVSILYTALAGTAVMSAVAPWSWQAPQSALHLLLFVGVGLLGGVSHFFVIRALQNGPASLISPLGYLELLGATVLGYLVFGNFPDAWTFVGAGIIAASGGFVAYREAVRARTGGGAAPEAPPAAAAPVAAGGPAPAAARLPAGSI